MPLTQTLDLSGGEHTPTSSWASMMISRGSYLVSLYVDTCMLPPIANMVLLWLPPHFYCHFTLYTLLLPLHPLHLTHNTKTSTNISRNLDLIIPVFSSIQLLTILHYMSDKDSTSNQHHFIQRISTLHIYQSI